MSDQSLAKVGDVIAHGEAIPANVVQFTDRDRRIGEFWRRSGADPLRYAYFSSGNYGDATPLDFIRSMPKWWPMTVVEVDPEPQPAETYDPDEPVHYYFSELRAYATYCGIGIEDGLSTTDEAGKATCETCLIVAEEEPPGAPQPAERQCFVAGSHSEHLWEASSTRFRCPGYVGRAGVPQPTERKLIGPPHAHLDAPCTGACYEPTAPESAVLVGETDADGYLRLKGTATGDASDPSTFAECVAWLIDAGLGSNADRRIDRMASQHQELQARYDTVVSDRATVKASLERVKERVREFRQQPAESGPLVSDDEAARMIRAFDAVRRLAYEQLIEHQHASAHMKAVGQALLEVVNGPMLSAESGPITLSLPQVPDGAVALVGCQSGVRYARYLKTASWERPDDGSILPLYLLFGGDDELTPEFAPPREPRTWPRFPELTPEELTALPWAVDVTLANGAVMRWTCPEDSIFFEHGDSQPRTLLSLRELGEVREVLT